MAKCDACGNDYDKSFQVVARGKTHTFDSFECAIHALAPAPRKALDPRQFPLRAQTNATTGREKVREAAHAAYAPRQSKRRAERTNKSRTGT